MKIRRKYFNEFIEGRFKIIKIKEDRYIILISLLSVFKALLRFVGKVLMLPIGLLVSILDSILDCIKELPMYFSDLKSDFCAMSPIRYVKVVDEELVETSE